MRSDLTSRTYFMMSCIKVQAIYHSLVQKDHQSSKIEIEMKHRLKLTKFLSFLHSQNEGGAKKKKPFKQI